MRKKRVIAAPKSHVTCEVPLHDTIRIPFNELKEKFARFGDQHDIDLTNVEITDTDIRGSFTNSAGVTHDIHFMQDGGTKSYLDGSIYKNMDHSRDNRDVEKSVEELIQALLLKEDEHSPFKRFEAENSAPS